MRDHFAVAMFADHAANAFVPMHKNWNQDFAMPNTKDERLARGTQSFKMLASAKFQAGELAQREQEEPTAARCKPKSETAT
ncbi:MAG: hypothetical protein AAB354_11425 [candidate division KSB1 bacterium]